MYHVLTVKYGAASKRPRVEFVHPDDVLDMVLDNNEETSDMSSDEESDLDRQLENQSKESRIKVSDQ